MVCSWDVAESRFLSAVADGDVRAVLRQAVWQYLQGAPGKVERAELEQESLLCLFLACREENLREIGIEQFSSLLRRILSRRLYDLTVKYYAQQKRNPKCEVVSIDEVETEGADFTFAIARESVEDLIVRNDFRAQLALAVARVGNATTMAVLESITGDTAWKGSPSTYRRHRGRIIEVGRTLLGVRPTMEADQASLS